jgi:putative MFS transporter
MEAQAPAVARLSTYHRWLFFFLGVAGFFEGWDTFALSQLLPQIRAEWTLSKSDAGWLVGVIAIGSILSYGLVRYADRWGRRRVLAITIIGYALCTLLTGLATSVWMFGLAQLLARIFLIAEWAVGMVYAAEEFPADRRGTVIGILNGLNGLGAVVCAALAPLLVTTPLGWRSVYFVGAIPLLLMAVARRSLRETRRFTEQVAGREVARGAFSRVLSPPWRNRMLLLALLWALTYASNSTAITFWKDHALEERHFTDAQVGVYVAIAAVAAMPLAFASGNLIDRVGRRRGAVIIYAAIVLGVLGCYLIQPRALILLSLVLGIAGTTAVGAVLSAFNTELFATDIRGDAVGWSNSLLGRIGAVLSPLLVGYAAELIGWARAVSLTVICPCIALVLVLRHMPETRGRELEETSGQAS